MLRKFMLRKLMLRKPVSTKLLLVFAVATVAVCVAGSANAQSSIQVYGAWHCGNDYCTWGTVRNMTDFDTANHWMIDRDMNDTYLPSVNLVVLSFVQPLKLLDKTTDSGDLNGVPVGMNATVVSYFTSHNVRVMLSIGGATYTTYWDQALTQNATQLGLNAAALAKSLGVGIEIDYENSSSPNIAGLQAFINAYRSQLPYDATGANPAARLTIDLAAGDRYLIGLCQTATSTWLTTSAPVLDYANAMVPNKQPGTSAAESNWQEHIDGEPQYNPPIGPLAPAKFTGSVYIVTGKNPAPECTNFSASLENSTGAFVETVAPNGAGTTPGMLGYMFWAAECQGTRSICTTPPNTCQGGVGVGAATYDIPIPMPALRQQ
jgi:hypothetical protein